MNNKSEEMIHKNKNKDFVNEKTTVKKKSTVTIRSPKSKVAVSSENTSSLQALPSTSRTRNGSKIKIKDSKKHKFHEELLKDSNHEEYLDVNIIQAKYNDKNNDPDSNKGIDTNNIHFRFWY